MSVFGHITFLCLNVWWPLKNNISPCGIPKVMMKNLSLEFYDQLSLFCSRIFNNNNVL